MKKNDNDEEFILLIKNKYIHLILKNYIHLYKKTIHIQYTRQYVAHVE